MNEDNMFELGVQAKRPNGTEWGNLGSYHLFTVPRIGEAITVNVEGYETVFEVVAVHHATQPASCAGELYVVQTGGLLDVLERLFDETPPAAGNPGEVDPVA